MALPRSSWKAEAIRRGDLKISGPLPITEETPLSEEEERRFAQKSGLDASLQTPDVSGEQFHQPETPVQPEQPPASVAVQASALSSNPVDGHLPHQEDMLSRAPTNSPPRRRQEPEDVQRESIVRLVPLTTPSPFGTTPDSTLMTAQSKKRKSGLRGVFRKMFGRKVRDGTEIGEDEAVPRGHSYHHSVRDTKANHEARLTTSRILECCDDHVRPGNRIHPLEHGLQASQWMTCRAHIRLASTCRSL